MEVTMTKAQTTWSVLSKIDVSDHVEKKNNLTYLSWAWAWGILKDKYPHATFEKHCFDHECGRLPYAADPAGNTFVSVTVTIGDDAMTEVMPVLNHANKPVKSPDAFQINSSLQRALAKAIGLHGLGAYIYQGEDLPPDEKKEEDIPSFDEADSEAEDVANIDQPTPVAATPAKDDESKPMTVEEWREGLLGHPENPVKQDGDTITIAEPANSEGAHLILKVFSTFMPTLKDYADAKKCVEALTKFWRTNKKAMEALRAIDTKHEETCLSYFKAAKTAANNGEIWELKE